MDILNNKYFKWLSIATVAMLFLFLGAATLHQLKQADGSDVVMKNSITVSGDGEAVAVPDIATFSFTVSKEAKTSLEVQKLATDISNKILDAVKKDGVDEKDIKTTGYNLYPKYDYPQTICPAVYPSTCVTGKEVLRGFAIDQTFEIKVRDISKAGTLIVDSTSAGASNISGPVLSVDKEDDVIAKARNEAISKAKEKAESIAKGLGVRLVRVLGFSENDNGYNQPTMNKALVGPVTADSIAVPPMPTGENKYTRTVQVTYEIE